MDDQTSNTSYPSVEYSSETPIIQKDKINWATILIGIIGVFVILGLGAYLGVSYLSSSDKISKMQTAIPSQNKIQTQIATSPTSSSAETIQPQDNLKQQNSQFKIKVFQPYFPEGQPGIEFVFSYDKLPNDTLEFIPAEFADNYHEGIKITRNGAILIVKPAFEGINVPYYDNLPEVHQLTNKNLYRIFGNVIFGEPAYNYVTNYSENCDHWEGESKTIACHDSNGLINNIPMTIECDAKHETVLNCDQILSTLEASENRSEYYAN